VADLFLFICKALGNSKFIEKPSRQTSRSEIEMEITLLFYRCVSHSSSSLSFVCHERNGKKLLRSLGLSEADFMDAKQKMADTLGMFIPGGRALYSSLTLTAFLRHAFSQCVGMKTHLSLSLSSSALEALRSSFTADSPEVTLDSILLDLEPIRIVAASLHLPQTTTLHEFWDRTLNGDLYYRSMTTDAYDFGEQAVMEEFICQSQPNAEKEYLKLMGSDRKVSVGILSAKQLGIVDGAGLDLMFQCALNSIVEVRIFFPFFALEQILLTDRYSFTLGINSVQFGYHFSS
jgi:hypothetical protein